MPNSYLIVFYATELLKIKDSEELESHVRLLPMEKPFANSMEADSWAKLNADLFLDESKQWESPMKWSVYSYADLVKNGKIENSASLNIKRQKEEGLDQLVQTFLNENYDEKIRVFIEDYRARLNGSQDYIYKTLASCVRSVISKDKGKELFEYQKFYGYKEADDKIDSSIIRFLKIRDGVQTMAQAQ